MPKTWLLPGILLLACVVLSRGQQPADQPSDHERIAQLELQVKDLQRAMVALSGGDGAIQMAPAVLETRLSRLELRLDRLEQQAIRSSGPAGASSDRMIDGRIRALENAVMRLQQR
jgi:hypothetical protein